MKNSYSKTPSATREISDAAGSDGLPLLIGSDADDVHARRYRRLRAGDAVLENQAVVGFDTRARAATS